MDLAIGEPLQDVSDVVLKGMNSKSIKSGLTKYNPDKCKGYNVVNTRKRQYSPSRQRPVGDDESESNVNSYDELSKDVQNYLRDLTRGASDKMSLIKMQVVKADQSAATYARLVSCLKSADITEAERLLECLIGSNSSALNELQSEIAEGINIVQSASGLSYVMKQEKQDQTDALAELNKGKAISPRKVLETAKSSAMTAENQKLV
jgi:type VI protein secretion system component VasK